jgi:tetratricopeptide (TPR) repeat protein
MAEIWDIARYVEANPDDHEQRWRLAKKLYTAWEYRLALEHLKILKNEGQERINILRYLAATYYRLGRYDEATAELREAIGIWPDEIGLTEQLARVLEIAGDHPGAADMWERTLDLDPHHPMAAHAAARLRSSTPDTAKKKRVR